jgi:hypothetical protein
MLLETYVFVLLVEKLLEVLVAQSVALLVSAVILQVLLETVISQVDVGGCANFSHLYLSVVY